MKSYERGSPAEQAVVMELVFRANIFTRQYY